MPGQRVGYCDTLLQLNALSRRRYKLYSNDYTDLVRSS